MRLWTIHPCFLSKIYLTALWAEGHLALSVFEGATKSYKNHPQLERFKIPNGPDRVLLTKLYLNYAYMINSYVFKMNFNKNRISGITNENNVMNPEARSLLRTIKVPYGQVLFELWYYANVKNVGKNKSMYVKNQRTFMMDIISNAQSGINALVNPIFTIDEEDTNIASWEKTFNSNPVLRWAYCDYKAQL